MRSRPARAGVELHVSSRAVLVGTGSTPVELGEVRAAPARSRWPPPTGPAASASHRGSGSMTAPTRQPARAVAAGRSDEARGSAAPPRPRERTRRARADPVRRLRRCCAPSTTDAYANLDAADAAARHRLDGRDAAFATELAYGTLPLAGQLRRDHRRRPPAGRLTAIDPPVLDVLRLGAHQLLGMRVPPHAAVDADRRPGPVVVGAGAARLRQRRAAPDQPSDRSTEWRRRRRRPTARGPGRPPGRAAQPPAVGRRARCARPCSATAVPRRASTPSSPRC